jgi:MFS family permease
VVSTDRTPSFWRHFDLILGVSALWLPLSMLFNSLQSLVLPVFVLRFVAPAQKGTVLGLILFVGLAAGALIQPIAGLYSDRLTRERGTFATRWGRRQPLIVAGALLTLAFLAGFALASNITLLAITYIGVTVTAGITQAGFQGLLPDFVPAQLRGRAAGLKGFLELLGSVLGFSIAGILLKKGQPSGVLMAIGIVLVIGVLLSLALVREGARLRSQDAVWESAHIVPPVGPVTTLAQQASRETLPVPEAASHLDVRTVFTRVLVSRFLFLLSVYGIGHFLLYYMRDRLHLVNAAGATSVLFTVFTIVTALVAIGGGVLSDRIGRLPVLWGAAGLSAVGALLLVPATTVALILIGGGVMSVGSGLFAAANWALTADLTPRGAGGRFFGLLAVATGGAAALAGLFGVLVDRAGYNPLFVVTALLFAGSAVVLPRAAQIARAAHAATAG